MFFSSWTDLARVLIVGTLAYAVLVMMLRISGKRTLSKLNAFDLIVTIALGSTLATVLLSKDVALAEGLLAFALLIGLQWVVAWLSVRSRYVREFVKSEPRLLLFRGEYLEGVMARERITRDEIQAAIQAPPENDDRSALNSVVNFPPQRCAEWSFNTRSKGNCASSGSRFDPPFGSCLACWCSPRRCWPWSL